ncbi:nucleotide exchange factor GrpE [Kiritimatiellaeota bacterium B1221]|nr:nucleotide exchange factor GrpE [Kiritimatiellaeota bacterium B1221]
MSKKTKKEEKPEDPVEEIPAGEETLEVLEPEVEAAADAAEAGEKKKEEEEQEDYKDQYLRLRADFDNFRKRTRREKEEWTQRSLDNVVTDLLKVLDSFDLGIENSKGKEFTEETLKGFELVRGQLSSTLGTYGLKEVEVADGNFDPNLHEAITHMPSQEVAEGGIVAVTRKGYQLGSRLLRPVQVVVSAGAPEGEESEKSEEAEENA